MGEIVRDWTKLVVPRKNENDFVDGKEGDPSLRTMDLVSIRSVGEIAKRKRDNNDVIISVGSFTNKQMREHQKTIIKAKTEKRRSGTDFAFLNGLRSAFDVKTETGKNASSQLLRSTSANKSLSLVDSDGLIISTGRTGETYGLCPSISLKIPVGITERQLSNGFGDLSTVRNLAGKVLYHTIEIGEYPQTRVSKLLSKKLETLYNGGNLKGNITCTGRHFTTVAEDSHFQSCLSRLCPEFSFNGQKYVRVTSSQIGDTRYGDGAPVVASGGVEWVRVEPIKFRISNYDDIKNGSAKTLELDSEEILISGVPMSHIVHKYNTMWQNSYIRAFLNSADSNKLNKNPKFKTPERWDFRNRGFLHEALNMTRQPVTEYTVSEFEMEVPKYAFRGCVGLKKITIPTHVTKIGKDAFEGCVNAQIVIENFNKLKNTDFSSANAKYIYLSKNGERLILSPYEDKTLENDYYAKKVHHKNDILLFAKDKYKSNFLQVMAWNEKEIVKFLPPDFTLELFPRSELANYFMNKNSQRWRKLVKTLGFDTLKGDEKNNSLVDLMKIYYALGGFSSNQGESEKAYDYVLKHVATTRKSGETPSQIGAEVHARFSKIDMDVPYNPIFAKFFMKYYHKNPDFMNFRLADKDGNMMDSQDYLCMAHNSFDRILKAYPYRGVNGNEERSLLTPRFVAEHSTTKFFNNVRKGNEELAELVGRYGYSQNKFEMMQEIYDRAKQIEEKRLIPAVKSADGGRIIFRVLEKADPLGFVLGDITNCCQHIGGAGASCVEDGYINPNSGFLVFEEPIIKDGKPTGKTRILGQAYIWYDPKTNTVCYDNIEIPTKVLNELRGGDKRGCLLSGDAFMDAVIESADALILAMNKKGVKVNRVTTGEGYNDLKKELQERFGNPEKNPVAKNRGYNGYSDADEGQYLIRTLERTKMGEYTHSKDIIER